MDGFESTRLIRAFEKIPIHQSSSSKLEAVPTAGEQTTESSDQMQAMVKADTQATGRPRSYIVALTGLASRRDRDEADTSGFDDFLTKPTPFNKIGALLKRLSEAKEARLSILHQGLLVPESS